MILKKVIKNSTKKLITVSLLVGALTQPSYSWGNWKIEKTEAAIMGGIVCYTHPEYQIKENTCVIDRLVWVGDSGKVDIAEPYEVKFEEKFKAYGGGDAFMFCYRKPNKPSEEDDDFCIAVVVSNEKELYKIVKESGIIDRLAAVGSYGKVDIAKPYEVKFEEKFKAYGGGDAFMFCYRKPNKPSEKDDDFCVAAVVEPPQLYFSKLKKQKEEENNEEPTQNTNGYIGVNGNGYIGVNGHGYIGVNGQGLIGVGCQGLLGCTRHK
jgi:hypothetical protein